jgi:hypothetical protein
VVGEDELVEHAKSADYILVIWDKLKLDRPQPKYHLLDKINRPEVTAFIDGAEWTFNGHPNPKNTQPNEALTDPSRRRGEPWIWKEMNEKVKWHFKRECYPQDREEFGCIPLPFGAVNRHFRNQSLERKYSIQCSFGQLGTGLRHKVQSVCEELNTAVNSSNSIHLDNMLIGKLPHEQYLTAMSEAYAVVDAWGGGDCNARHYEAAANGAVLFYQKYQILTPYPYLDGVTAITYSTPEEFREKALYYFHKNRRLDEVKELGRKSFEHTLKHHTSKARVEYMFDVIQEKLNVNEIIG